MARKELKAIPVLVHLEASLHEVLVSIVQADDDTMSTYFRSLLIRDADSRGQLSEELRRKLVGA